MPAGHQRCKARSQVTKGQSRGMSRRRGSNSKCHRWFRRVRTPSWEVRKLDLQGGEAIYAGAAGSVQFDQYSESGRKGFEGREYSGESQMEDGGFGAVLLNIKESCGQERANVTGRGVCKQHRESPGCPGFTKPALSLTVMTWGEVII